MTAEEFLSMAESKPIILSDTEKFARKQMINQVFFESGGGVLDRQVMQAIELFSTGQMSTEDALEFMRVLSQEHL